MKKFPARNSFYFALMYSLAMKLGYTSGAVIWGFYGMRECGTTVNILVLLDSFLIGVWATYMLSVDYWESGKKNVENLQLLFQFLFILFFGMSYFINNYPLVFAGFCLPVFVYLPFMSRKISKFLSASYTVSEENLERKESR